MTCYIPLGEVLTLNFNCIVVDPPWPMPETGKVTSKSRTKKGIYQTKEGRVVNSDWWDRFSGKTTKIPYSIMSVEEIKSLKIPSSDNAHLYLWTINRHIENAYTISRAWGFKPSSLLTWCKPTMGIGFGGTYCNSAEFCLFCRKGKLKAKRRIDSTWFNWSRPYINGHIAHSAKPEAFQDMVESVSPGPYLELFARRHRLGWTVWGNEVVSNIDLGFSSPSGI